MLFLLLQQDELPPSSSPSSAHLDLRAANCLNPKNHIPKRPEMSLQCRPYTTFAVSPNAEHIRKQIKKMLPVPRTGDSTEGKSEQAQKSPIKIVQVAGGVFYGGTDLQEKMTDLIKQITKISSIGKDWRYLVCYFHGCKRIENERCHMYLIPLSPNSTSGTVEERQAAYIKNKPMLNPGTSIIILLPPAIQIQQSE
ncbi:hypothetical protein PENVUL_c033G04785 [Penicillium vulpinum]|uniref:Uncharacterized protein n=1 Tax=Penicillium vulpinum TaxID=29845 RepID=A0A1V6RRP1_9EURO|nr:hypothetical protein PENVUL_c033G04785 [Penicillium vulpinum]